MSKDVQKVEVLKEDQDHINTFSKLNNKLHDLDGQIRAKKKLLEDLEDASNELMLSDEDSIRYVLGECFVHLDKDAAEERLEGITSTATQEVQGLEGQVEDIKSKMKELKALLYGKFGSSINLEE